MRWLAGRGVGSQGVVLFGHSLGTGMAIEMAKDFPVRGVMLLAPYLSMVKMAQLHFPCFPARLVVLDRYENDRKIGELRMPILIGNGARDKVIPPEQGRELFALANEPKEYRSLPDRGHNDGFDVFAAMSVEWLRQL
jgi:pimeloyl-ACP methyl ester carboxylesterase